MIFNRTYRFKSSLSEDNARQKLMGQKVQIHKMEFEVMEKEDILKLIPHAENSQDLKILPITHVQFSKNADNTTVTVKTKPRRIDIGGPYLLIIFCIFMFIIGLGFLVFKPGNYEIPLVLTGASVLIFTVFWFKMETGYFDYVRKIKSFVKSSIQ